MSGHEVRIDGVLYAPVSDAHIDVPRIEDALMEQWAGEGWRESFPNSINTLRVVVGDNFETDEGETIPEFVARIMRSLA